MFCSQPGRIWITTARRPAWKKAGKAAVPTVWTVLRRSAAAVRQAQQRVVPTQTRPREDPSYGDLVRTANQRAYSEDAKRLRNM